MRHLFKCIGGGLGWIAGEWIGRKYGFGVGGPVGGLMGFVVGTVIDSFEFRFFNKKDGNKGIGEFAYSLLVLISAVMKANQPVVKSELDYVKQFLKLNFNEKDVVHALAMLKDILKQDIRLNDAFENITTHLDRSSRMQFTHFLLNLANIDGQLSNAEQIILKAIENGLGVSSKEKRSIDRLLINEKEILMAYGTLGVRRNDSVIDIKKAYRKMANQYHPDKVAFHSDEVKKIAKDKFQQLTNAYEVIKKERNFT